MGWGKKKIAVSYPDPCKAKASHLISVAQIRVKHTSCSSLIMVVLQCQANGNVWEKIYHNGMFMNKYWNSVKGKCIYRFIYKKKVLFDHQQLILTTTIIIILFE